MQPNQLSGVSIEGREALQTCPPLRSSLERRSIIRWRSDFLTSTSSDSSPACSLVLMFQGSGHLFNEEPVGILTVGLATPRNTVGNPGPQIGNPRTAIWQPFGNPWPSLATLWSRVKYPRHIMRHSTYFLSLNWNEMATRSFWRPNGLTVSSTHLASGFDACFGGSKRQGSTLRPADPRVWVRSYPDWVKGQGLTLIFGRLRDRVCP